MKVVIFCVGRLKSRAEQDIIERYQDRFDQIGRIAGFASLSIVELLESRLRSGLERKRAEAENLQARIPTDSFVITLDERGRDLSSADFARQLERARDGGKKQICLVIGGPDGLDTAFQNQADLQLGFGRMTMPHGLVRAVLAEQLYRAITILTGHPYHRE